MEARRTKRWLRPRFTLAAMLLLITLLSPPFGYIANRRALNARRTRAREMLRERGVYVGVGFKDRSPPKPTSSEWWRAITNDEPFIEPSYVQYSDYSAHRATKPLTDEDLKLLVHFPEIERLQFYDAKIVTDKGLSVLAQLPALRWIILENMAQVNGEFLAEFRPNSLLEGIKFNGMAGLKGRNLEPIGSLTRLETIQIWNAAGLTDDGLARVTLPTSLRTLSLGKTPIGDATISRWLTQVTLHTLSIDLSISTPTAASLVHQTELQRIEIINAPLRDEDFSFVRSCPQLENISLSELPVRGEFLQWLASPMTLKSLRFDHTLFSDASLKHARQCTSLNELYLTWSPMSGEGFKQSFNWSNNPVIALCGNQFSDDGKTALAHVMGPRAIHMPSNWLLADMLRATGGKPVFKTITHWRMNTELHKLGKPVWIGDACSLQTCPREKKMDRCPPELMAPVFRLHELARLEREEYDRLEGKK